MLGWLTGTMFSLFTVVRIGSKTRSRTEHYGIVQWSIAVRAHNQFGSWT